MSDLAKRLKKTEAHITRLASRLKDSGFRRALHKTMHHLRHAGFLSDGYRPVKQITKRMFGPDMVPYGSRQYNKDGYTAYEWGVADEESDLDFKVMVYSDEGTAFAAQVIDGQNKRKTFPSMSRLEWHEDPDKAFDDVRDLLKDYKRSVWDRRASRSVIAHPLDEEIREVVMMIQRFVQDRRGVKVNTMGPGYQVDVTDHPWQHHIELHPESEGEVDVEVKSRDMETNEKLGGYTGRVPVDKLEQELKTALGYETGPGRSRFLRMTSVKTSASTRNIERAVKDALKWGGAEEIEDLFSYPGGGTVVGIGLIPSDDVNTYMLERRIKKKLRRYMDDVDEIFVETGSSGQYPGYHETSITIEMK